MQLTRRQAVLATAVASAAGAGQTSQAIANTTIGLRGSEPNYNKWFKVFDSALNAWSVNETLDENRVSILPKRIDLAADMKKVLVIYPRQSSAYDIAITKILAVFEDKKLDVSLTVVNFRNDPEIGAKLLKQATADKFDLILSMGSETTAWLWDTYRGGRIPVISVCSKDPVVLGQSAGYNVGTGTNFALTSLNMPIDVQMAYVNDLKPKLRNIAILVDSKNISAIETQSKPVADYARSRSIRVLELTIQDPANARNELERMVRDATAQMTRNDPDLSNSLYWVTGSTSVFREIATINANASRAAVLSVVPEIVRSGDDSAVLSIGISFESNAHLAAVYAADVIKGRTKVGDMKVGVVSPPDIAISFRKLRDIGMTIPLAFFEAAGTIYDYEGNPVRIDGVNATRTSTN